MPVLPKDLPAFAEADRSAAFTRTTVFDSSRFRCLDKPAPTVTTSHYSIAPYGGDHRDATRRRLTVEECKQLNGFFKEFTFPEEVEEREHYKAIGNAIPPKLVSDLFNCSLGTAKHNIIKPPPPPPARRGRA